MALLPVAAGLLILGACAGNVEVAPASTQPTPSTVTAEPTTSSTESVVADELCADVVDAVVAADGAGTFRVSATVSSPDTGEEKYADQWRVVGPDGTVLGVRVLTHPHVNEQPFTRSLSSVEIPGSVESVLVEARDSVEGYCGDSVTVSVP